MLSPKRVKFRKQHRTILQSALARRGNGIAFGTFALVAAETGFITARQIEAARIAMTRKIKRSGKVWIRIFPDTPFTKKPAETRMGKGKGSLEYWHVPVRPARVLFEMEGVSADLAREAMGLAAAKLPLRTSFSVKRGFRGEE